VALVRSGSVSLRAMHGWLASVLWPDQDEDDKVLRARLEASLEADRRDAEAGGGGGGGGGGDGNNKGHGGGIVGPPALGSTAHDERRKRGTMSVFRIKGILSVRHPLDVDGDGTVIPDDDPDYDPVTGARSGPDAIDPLTGLDRRRYIVQAVNDLWDIHPAGDALRWPAAARANDDDDDEEVVVVEEEEGAVRTAAEEEEGGGDDDDDDDDAGRICKLIVIGRNLNGPALEQGFGECFVRRPPPPPTS